MWHTSTLKKKNLTKIQIKLRGNKIIEQVDEFMYLESAISNGEKNSKTNLSNLNSFLQQKNSTDNKTVSLKIRKNHLKSIYM